MKQLVLLFAFMITLGAAANVWSDDLIMDKDALNAMLAAPDLVILDVRTGKDWSSSEFKIQSAVRAPAAEYADWSASYPKGKTFVLYCA
jgi:rhodanese-related sulfurtransferase